MPWYHPQLSMLTAPASELKKACLPASTREADELRTKINGEIHADPFPIPFLMSVISQAF